MIDETPKAVVLLSGGLDSATSAAIAMSQGFGIHALTFEYGQRHRIETQAANRVAASLPVDAHTLQHIDLRAFGGSALTDAFDVPKGRSDREIGDGIPITYVPARNLIFLAFATAYAEVIGSADIFIGVSAVDYSGYPDCRPEFIESFAATARLGTKAGSQGRPVRIHAPLIRLSKADTIAEAIRLGVDLSLTHSCYDPADDGGACGQCDSCMLRRKGFEESGVADPTHYA